MKLWLIVPVKPFQCGLLSELLLDNLLAVVSGVDILAKIIVVSQDDSAVRSIAYRHGVSVLQEVDSGLNAALTQASEYAREHGADSVLALPADLPLITAREIYQLYWLASDSPDQQMVIVPSRDGGTNALLLRPPGGIDFAFGLDSCQKHCDKAIAAGIPYTVWQSPALAVDVDRPTDLWALFQNRFFDQIFQNGEHLG